MAQPDASFDRIEISFRINSIVGIAARAKNSPNAVNRTSTVFVSKRGIPGPVLLEKRALRIEDALVDCIESGLVGSTTWITLLARDGKSNERRKVIELENMFGDVKGVIVVVAVSDLQVLTIERVLGPIVPRARVCCCQTRSVAG